MISLPFRLTICGLAELPDHSARGVSHVLSILDPAWPVPDAFGSFGEHARLELRFHDIIEDEPGQHAPRLEHIDQILAFGRDLTAEPPEAASLLVHCHAGISRSSAAMLLLLAQARPAAEADALARAILAIRPHAWPNLRMVEMGDARLGRGGALVRALPLFYREQIARRPDFVRAMIDGGRGREVAMAQSAARPAA